MLPCHSSPDSVLWSVIVSRVPGRLFGLLKPGRSGPRERVTAARAIASSRRRSPAEGLRIPLGKL
jgi:hypothetical protein